MIARSYRIASIVAIDRHETISLVWVECVQRSVHWDLLVVDAQTVAMSVWIREEARL